jgi:hypothetical protein
MKKKVDISKLNKKAPFELPDNYFDKLPGIIESRIAEEEDARIRVFNSSKVDKKLPFEVPENYFNDLPSIIQARAMNTNKKEGFSFGFAKENIKWALVPALIALLIVSYSVFFNYDRESFNTEQLISQVSSEDLVAYLESSEISEDEIMNSVDFEGLELEFESGESDMLDELDISEEELDDIFLEFDLETGV